MREVGAFEAKNTLGSLLDLVEKGEEIVITRRGRPVARLCPESSRFDQAAARAAAKDIIEMSRGVTLGKVAGGLKGLIEDGRR